MKKTTLKRIAAGAVAAALALIAAGCEAPVQSSASRQDDSLQRVLDAGELIIGYDEEFPPITFVDETGAVVGFDIDMAQATCDRLGVKLVKKPIDWDAKEDILNSGEIDCIWSGMSVTPAHAERMNLSEPYIQNQKIFLVPADSDARTSRDLKGKTVGVQPGTTEQEALEASDLFADISVVYDVNPKLAEMLRRGEVDAALFDSSFAYYFISSCEDRFFVLSDSLGEDEYSIAFRKNDQALRDKVQEIINGLAADGTLAAISNKWFGCDITIVR